MKTLALCLTTLILVSVGLAGCDRPTSLKKSITSSALVVPAGSPTSGQQAQLKGQVLGDISVPFIPNNGQVDDKVKFYAGTFGGTVFVTGKGKIVYSLPGGNSPTEDAQVGVQNKHRQMVLTEQFVGGKVQKITPGHKAETQVSIFHGNDPGKWQNELPAYKDISLGNVFPGVELRLSAHGKSVEKLFYIASGAAPEDIMIEVPETENMSILETGQLQIETDEGAVLFSQPVAWQDIRGERIDVDVAYAINPTNNHRYGFRVGHFSTAHPLVIDPLLQSTYLGGSSNDSALDLVIGPNGNIYVAGETSSSDFPFCSGKLCPIPADPAFAGTREAFVAKISPDLTQLIQTTYLGGSESETAKAITIDESGNVFITGYTSSSDFPGVSGGADSTLSGDDDGFVAKLSADLRSLQQATFIGGSATETPRDIKISDSGWVFVVGKTTSNDLPSCASATSCWPPQQADNTFAGASEAFVAQFKNDLTTMPVATYLGGGDSDGASALAIEPLLDGEDIYVTGYTNSDDFPGIAGGFDTTREDYEAFVTKLDKDLSSISQSTYYGGSDYEEAYGIEQGVDGTIFITGETSSTDLPHCTGLGCQPRADGVIDNSGDGFVASFNTQLTSLSGSSFLGGTGFEMGSDIAIVPAPRNPWENLVYVSGDTYSTDFPGTNNGADEVYGGKSDGFVVYLNSSLSEIQQASYIGGNELDEASALAVSSTGDIYVTGITKSANFQKASGGFGPVLHGERDAYITKFSNLEGSGSYYTIPIKNRKAAIIYLK